MKGVERLIWFVGAAAVVTLGLQLADLLQRPAATGHAERLELPRTYSPLAADAAQPSPQAATAGSFEPSVTAGREIVDRAIQAGVWTSQDALSFGAATASLEVSDRMSLQRRLIAAVNDDRVQIEGSTLSP
jgi:hypothetical protein